MDWFQQDTKIIEIPLFAALQAKHDAVITLPLYQRDAVWSEGRICALWDSLLRGFPLPSFLLVQGKGQSRRFRDHTLNPWGPSITPPGEYYNLLDGQQRLAAIDAVTWDEKNPLRLWLDLAPEKDKRHPLKFKYWLHACTRIFPFGFRIEASGEYDFAVLHDGEITELWEQLRDSDFEDKEFHDIPLAKTRPFRAACPVPLDELVRLLHPTQQNDNKLDCQTLSEVIFGLATTWKQYNLLHQKQQEPDEETVKQVVKGLLRVQQCKLAFQLLTWKNDDDVQDVDEEDDYTLFERIGRGGVQITQRQLAVSKLLLELGPDGNDVIAAFQSSEKLQHLLETEDVIHALARVAFTATEPKDEDLLDLTPQRVRTLQKDPAKKWDRFIGELRSYCQPSCQAPGLSRLQYAFEQLYDNLRYGADNPSGFPFVQLAQPASTGEGIAPITLHPLVYWYLKHADGEPVDTQHRDDMLRWVMFANGFTGQPQHLKLNSQVFQLVVQEQRLNFSAIKNLVFQDEKLVQDLGLSWNLPMLENGEIIQREYVCKDIPNPDDVTCRTARRLLLQNWCSSSINWFLLMWNQREILERLYGKTDYRPALFSKGRPFDADHIVARSHFLFIGIQNDQIRRGINAIMVSPHNFQPLTQIQSDVTKQNMKIEEWCFRKNWPNTIANYRYWPKRLNRSDQDKSVSCKINAAHVQAQIMGDPLQDKWPVIDSKGLWEWSVIPQEDQELWRQLPPKQWNKRPIGTFILATLKREHFLYTNAYRFLVS